MIHRQIGVGRVAHGRHKRAVRWEGAQNGHAFIPQLLTHGRDHRLVFRTQMSAFSRMRVEPEYSDSRFTDVKTIDEIGMKGSERLLDDIAGQRFRHVAKR